jgi:hypothetical protein
VDPPLSALFELEMLNGVRHENPFAGDAGVSERTVKKLAGRADKGMSREIFRIAWLLANEQQGRVGFSFSEDRLRRGCEQRTPFAAFSRGV